MDPRSYDDEPTAPCNCAARWANVACCCSWRQEPAQDEDADSSGEADK